MAVKYISKNTADNSVHSLEDRIADITFMSDSNPSAVTMNRIALDGGHISADGRLWIHSFSQLNDLKMELVCHGENEIQIQSIVLKEQIRYRYVRVAEVLLGMALLNLIYIVFWSKGIDLPSLKSRKKTALYLMALSAIAGLPLYADFVFVGHDLYFHMQRMARSRSIGLIGTAVYLFSSYRLINVHVRAAVGEYTAMCFLPLAVYGLWRIYEQERPTWKDWLPLSITMSSIVQCHILTVEMVMLFILVFVLANIRKTLMPQRLSALVKAALTSVGISAWFVFPFLESMFCLPVAVSGQGNKIQSSGLFLVQLFSFFIHGNGTNVEAGMVDEMPLSIGIALTFGIVVSLYVCLQRSRWNLEENPKYKLMRLSFIFGAAALFLTLKCFPYDHLQDLLGAAAARLIGMVQFSWRYLTIATVLLSVTVTMALAVLKDFNAGAYKIAVGVLVCGQLLFTGVFYWQYTQKANEDAFLSSDNYAQTMQIGMGEYLLENVDREQLSVSECKIVSGNISISSYQKIRGKVNITCRNEGNEEAEILLPVLDYGNYHVHDINTGKEYPLETGDNSQIQISVEAGYEGVLEVSYIPPVRWRAAEIVSLIVTTFIIFIIVKERNRKDVK